MVRGAPKSIALPLSTDFTMTSVAFPRIFGNEHAHGNACDRHDDRDSDEAALRAELTQQAPRGGCRSPSAFRSAGRMSPIRIPGCPLCGGGANPGRPPLRVLRAVLLDGSCCAPLPDLGLDDFRIGLARGQQLLVRTKADRLAIFEHEDLVRVHDR